MSGLVCIECHVVSITPFNNYVTPEGVGYMLRSVTRGGVFTIMLRNTIEVYYFASEVQSTIFIGTEMRNKLISVNPCY